MTDISADNDRRFKQLAKIEEIDVAILGAGINGAGVFRDLCVQGVDCLIVDKADFGSGTSSAPSRLIHGGLKYLETGEFGLVAQSTLERNLLLRNAPHCVEPLPTFIPVFSWTRGIWAALRTLTGSTTAPRSRGAVLVKIGLQIYDFFGARNRVMPDHRFLLRKRALKEMPHVTPDIVAGGIYYDAKISRPERLVFELVTDGLEANGNALATNFTTLLSSTDGVLTFQRANGDTFSVRPKLVINASGPWIDSANTSLGTSSKLIGGTKGSHILLDHPELVKSLNGHMIYFEADDGRICLVYDYLSLAMVGSTDIPASDPESVRCEEPEIEYFLESVRALLPSLSFSRDQVVYTYSGIRPLPASAASSPGLISRDHSAPVSEPAGDRPFPVISLVGGKWTTFRGFSEEVANLVLKRFERQRLQSTQQLAIGGGRNFPSDPAKRRVWVNAAAQKSNIDAPRIDVLLSRYGTLASAILDHAAVCEHSDSRRLSGAPHYSLLEIDWIARKEFVVHLSDVVLRRTTIAIEGALTMEGLQEMAKVTAEALGWDMARAKTEVDDVVNTLLHFHGQDLQRSTSKITLPLENE